MVPRAFDLGESRVGTDVGRLKSALEDGNGVILCGDIIETLGTTIDDISHACLRLVGEGK